MSSESKQLFYKILENFQSAVTHIENIMSDPDDSEVYGCSALRLQVLRTDIEKISSMLSTRYAEDGQMTQLVQLYNTQLSLNSCIWAINEPAGDDALFDDFETLKSEILLFENLINKLD